MNNFPRLSNTKFGTVLFFKEQAKFFLALSIYVLYYLAVMVSMCVVTVCRTCYTSVTRALFSVCEYARTDPVERSWMDRALRQASSFEMMLMARLESTTHKHCIVIASACQSSHYEFMAGNICAYSMRRADKSSYWYITITLSDVYYVLKDLRHEINHSSRMTLVATSDMNYMDERATPPTVLGYTNFNLMELYQSHLAEHIKDINHPVFKEMLSKAST